MYKKGTKADPKNFRPVSLLPIVPKIFEKVIHDKNMEYLTDNNIIYKYQSIQFSQEPFNRYFTFIPNIK